MLLAGKSFTYSFSLIFSLKEKVETDPIYIFLPLICTFDELSVGLLSPPTEQEAADQEGQDDQHGEDGDDDVPELLVQLFL